jgi:hypothetical protein
MNKQVIFILILIFFPFANADIISINSGGGKDISIDFGGYIENFFSCSPLTCSGLSYTCGTASDGCGGTLSCGSCASGYTCSSGSCTAVSVTAGGAGGGGGGGSSPPLAEIKVIPESFNLPGTVGVTNFGKISILNTGDVSLAVNIELSNLEGIIEFEKTKLFLEKGKEEILEFRVLPQEKPGIYAGKIILTAGVKRLEVPVAINVKSEMSLFDISIELSKEKDIIEANQTLTGQVILLQAGLQEKADVTVAYVIKDFEGNVYSETSETIMVYKEKSYEHEFATQNLPPGDYLVGAEVIYSGGVATASHLFKVIDAEVSKSYFALSLELIAMLSVIIMLILLLKKYKSKSLPSYRKK